MISPAPITASSIADRVVAGRVDAVDCPGGDSEGAEHRRDRQDEQDDDRDVADVVALGTLMVGHLRTPFLVITSRACVCGSGSQILGTGSC